MTVPPAAGRVATSAGAPTGPLRPWLRWPVPASFGGMLIEDLPDPAAPDRWGRSIALAGGLRSPRVAGAAGAR